MFRVFITFCALALSQSANAEPVLWRSLAAGQSPDDVKMQLEAMPEVKRVKNVKKKGVFSKQDINMNDGKVPIFEGHFAIETAFKDERLSRVVLTSGAGCLDDGYPFAEKMHEELARKYPILELPFPSASEFTLRALESSESRMSFISRVYNNDEIYVIFRTSFVQVNPPVYYGGSALARSIYNIARTSYDASARACGGAFYRTAQFSLSYVSHSDWNELKDAFEREDAEEREAAAENI